MNPQTDVLTSYLTFRLGDEIFALNVGRVFEILEIPKITKVPKSPNFMRGVINLRGSVLPVIDSRIKFGLGASVDTINSCIMVVNITIENEEVQIGALVDSVQEVIEIDKESIRPAPSIGSKYKSEFIEGMVKKDDQFIMLLNIDLVFSTDETTILQDLAINSESGDGSKNDKITENKKNNH